jgi:spore coat protein CotH
MKTLVALGTILVAVGLLGCGDDGSSGGGEKPDGAVDDGGPAGSGGAAASSGQSGGGSGGNDPTAASGGSGAGEGGDSGGGSGEGGDSGGGSGEGGDSGGSGDGGDGGEPMPIDETPELYDPANLPRFDITLPQASMDALGVDPVTYVTGELRYGDEVVTNIGVRIKGEYSKRTLAQKAPFKLKFDEFVPQQTFRGLRRMTFNNMMEDPSFVAERLAYHVYRAAGLPAPRCNSALVYVNGDFFGVYANVETEDKTFLRRWFGDEDGNLYEEGQRDFLHGSENAFDLETNETANDRTDLLALIEVVENTTPETLMADISPVLDMEHFLKFTALEGLVNQWDMYGYTRFYPNNFRFYHDPTSDKFVFLPWGMDMSMKPFDDQKYIQMLEVANNGVTDTAGKIFVYCLQSTECRSQYIAVIEEMLEVFEGEDLETLAETYFDQIKPHIDLDMRKEVGSSYVDEMYLKVIEHIEGRGDAVRAELAAE